MRKNVIYVDFVFKKKKVGFLNYYVIDKFISAYNYIKNLLPNSSTSSYYEIPIKKVQ